MRLRILLARVSSLSARFTFIESETTTVPSVFTQAKRHVRIAKKLNFTATHKMLIMLSIVGIVLYTMFFSTMPAVHDYFHGLRHSLMMIPCH